MTTALAVLLTAPLTASGAVAAPPAPSAPPTRPPAPLTRPASAASPQVAAPPTGAPSIDPAALRRSIDAIVTAGVPGAFAEVRWDDRRWRGASGVADLTTNREMRPDLRHRVGSITKTFVATTLLQLVGEGRLGIDDPVVRWLPTLTGLDRRVTVRMLLRHTSGIDDYTGVIFADLDKIVENRHYRPKELVAIGLGTPRVGEPGKVWKYSNTNYIIAGLLLERLTGRDATEEITRRLIRPLGLRDTYFPGRSSVIRGPHSRAYVPWTQGWRDFSVYRMTWAWTAGELISTGRDLNRFFAALLGGRLLPPAQLAAMRATVPMDPAQPARGLYGLGLLSVPTPCGPVWGHDGVTFGHAAISLHTPDGRRQLTLAMNATHYRQRPDQAHPIDIATANALMTALCGSPSRDEGSAVSDGRSTTSGGRTTADGQALADTLVRSLVG